MATKDKALSRSQARRAAEHQAFVMGLRSSNASAKHVSPKFKGTRSAQVRAAIRDSA